MTAEAGAERPPPYRCAVSGELRHDRHGSDVASGLAGQLLFRLMAMKLSDFASEFDTSVLQVDLGTPMTKSVLKTQIEAKGAAFRVEEALANLLTNAVSPYYFAKRVCPALDGLSAGQQSDLAGGFREVRNSLLKSAVIGVATTIDTVDKSEGHTRSIPHALHALKRYLTTRQVP